MLCVPFQYCMSRMMQLPLILKLISGASWEEDPKARVPLVDSGQCHLTQSAFLVSRRQLLFFLPNLLSIYTLHLSHHISSNQANLPFPQLESWWKM